MNIYIYSDESGTFDCTHNRYYVFGGLIVLGSESKSEWEHRYAKAENCVRREAGIQYDKEIKGSTVEKRYKARLFRSLNNCHKFAVVIDEARVLAQIYTNKKAKQRYLDFAYKCTVRHALESLIKSGSLKVIDVENIYFFVDEHSTATDGKYELHEALEQELKHGTYNFNYGKFFPPVFPDVNDVHLEYCNSQQRRLVRAADIVSNKIYHMAIDDRLFDAARLPNMFIEQLPRL